ncbi:NAD(P)-binding protein [Cantharellus anzutake]|uniref:NAD(P)-binding protein n=1 Tax=Cantharellus anzutake TaxID=1750568 RepID=UPI001906432E|nr:NAD(P)-binding protein [Cantharellus anzutake]KAF8336454.1 NAD(P)-binding protein [Cantharellus anzutake]
MSSSSYLHPGIPFSRPSTPSLHKSIGWIGLGSMGYLMARNLAKHLEGRIIVYNRTRAKSEKLQEELGPNKIKVVDAISELVIASDVVFTNLANDEVVNSVYDRISHVLTEHPPNATKIFVDTSTIYPTLAGQLKDKISAFNSAHFVMAPVFGAPPAADAAKLIVVLGGDYESRKEIAYLMVPSVGRKAIDLGENVEKPSALKLIGNSFILGTIELLAETMTLAEKSGVGAPALFGVVKGELQAPQLQKVHSYGSKILNDDFDGTKGFSLAGGLKDAGHIRRLGFENNSPMPTIDIAHQHLLTARALHTSNESASKSPFEVLDWSALVAGARVAAGLPGFDNHKVQTGGVVLGDH